MINHHQAALMLPMESDIKLAAAGREALLAYLATHADVYQMQISGPDQPLQVELPAYALNLLVDILAEVAQGNAVQVMPVHAELTTQEAADLLNVSRPHVVKLLEQGAIAFHKTGKHRRVRFADVMEYKAARARISEQATAELAQQAQDLGMGYE